MAEPRIIISVRGGLVDAVHSDVRINVDVLDYDDLESESEETEFALHYLALEKEVETLPYTF